MGLHLLGGSYGACASVKWDLTAVRYISDIVESHVMSFAPKTTHSPRVYKLSSNHPCLNHVLASIFTRQELHWTCFRRSSTGKHSILLIWQNGQCEALPYHAVLSEAVSSPGTPEAHAHRSPRMIWGLLNNSASNLFHAGDHVPTGNDMVEPSL